MILKYKNEKIFALRFVLVLLATFLFFACQNKDVLKTNDEPVVTTPISVDLETKNNAETTATAPTSVGQETKNKYVMMDQFHETKTMKFFFNDFKRLENLKIFAHKLENAKTFKFSSTYQQFITVFDRKHVPTSAFYSDQPPKINDEGIETVNINAIQIDENSSLSNNLEIESGTFFGKNDFFPNNTQTISIILGSDYKNDFSIGEKISIEYWFDKFEATIIGFLKPGSYYSNFNQKTSLNSYLVIPYLDLSNVKPTQNNFMFQGITYTSRINGVVEEKTGFEFEDIKKEIAELCKTYNVPSFKFQKLDPNAKQFEPLELQN